MNFWPIIFKMVHSAGLEPTMENYFSARVEIWSLIQLDYECIKFFGILTGNRTQTKSLGNFYDIRFTMRTLCIKRLPIFNHHIASFVYD